MSGWFPPQEPDYGNDCLLCHLATFTPRVFGIMISGVETGDTWLPWMGQPPNGLYIVEQDPGNPCQWINLPGVPLVQRYWVEVGHSWIAWEFANFMYSFIGDIAIACERFFNNWYATPVGNFFWNGQLQVIPLWDLEWWINKITPVVDPDPLLKLVPRSDGKAVISYIDRWGDTKFKMLVDLNP